jgi:hypothetical protein
VAEAPPQKNIVVIGAVGGQMGALSRSNLWRRNGVKGGLVNRWLVARTRSRCGEAFAELDIGTPFDGAEPGTGGAMSREFPQVTAFCDD